MDTKWRNNAKLIGWLFLFTFGLSGVHPLLFRGYYGDPYVAYTFIAFGIAALAFCVYTFQHVRVLETLCYAPWREGYHRMPIDVRVVVASICLSLTIVKLNENRLNFQFDAIYYAQSLVVTTVFVTLTMIQMVFLADVIRDSKLRHDSWQRSMMCRTASAFRDSFLSRSVGIQLFWTISVFFASGFGFLAVLLRPQGSVLYLPLLIIVTLPTLIAAVRRTGYLNRMVENTARLVQGLEESDLPVRGSSTLATLASNINQLKRGVEISQAAQAKSERLKTDLITNVSHDLRTPLTSIITYTELLKKPDIEQTDRAMYIDVIDKKSQRLKLLIDDLFEASKMASGNTELVKERIDITQLLQQALAERDEAISAALLDFRVSKPDTPVYCVVDGHKMWRVFDNLIGNILKYSLEHTRVYVSVETSLSTTTLTLKNIAKYELGGDIDELFERFKRGDESRHTEGSGLGLAIAKSIVALHGGTLVLDTDGDLFKATITLPNEA